MFDTRLDSADDLTAIRAASTITVAPHPETTTLLHLAGPLERDSAPVERATMTAAMAGGQPNLILDVRDVPNIDGAGATSLVFGMLRVQQAGGDLRLVGPMDQVKHRLELARLNDVLPIHAAVVEALEVNAAMDPQHAND